MAGAASRLCSIDGVALCAVDGAPLATHARCWRCKVLVGPGHPEAIGEPGQLGLCRSCARSFGAWLQAGNGQASATASPTRAAGRYLTPRQVAELTGLSHRTILNKIKAGKIPARVIPSADPRGVRKRVLARDVEKLFKSAGLAADGDRGG